MQFLKRQSEESGSTIPAPAIGIVVQIQLLVLVLLIAVLAFIDLQLAVAIAAGGMLHLVPQTYFTIRTFRYRGANNIHRAYISASQGLMMKFLMLAVGLALIFKFWQGVSLPVLLAGYLAMQVSSWVLYPILINRPLWR